MLLRVAQGLQSWHDLASIVGADNLAISRVVRSTRLERMIGDMGTTTVPKHKLEAVRELYHRYTGGKISLEEVQEFGDYLIQFICAINDI